MSATKRNIPRKVRRVMCQIIDNRVSIAEEKVPQAGTGLDDFGIVHPPRDFPSHSNMPHRSGTALPKRLRSVYVSQR